MVNLSTVGPSFKQVKYSQKFAVQSFSPFDHKGILDYIQY